MTLEQLRTKKITAATVKSFINKAEVLFVESISSFSGMSDCVEQNTDRKLVEVPKDKAIGHSGVWMVGSSRDYFTFKETETHYGIEVYNSCGCGVLWTKK